MANSFLTIGDIAEKKINFFCNIASLLERVYKQYIKHIIKIHNDKELKKNKHADECEEGTICIEQERKYHPHLIGLFLPFH